MAILFALLLPTLMVGVGGGIEVARSVEYKQRLISAADLTCRQAEIYLETLPVASLKPASYATTVQKYANDNRDLRNLAASATITATATTTATNTAAAGVGVRPGNVRVVATGKLDYFFKNILGPDDITVTVTRDCTVDPTLSPGTLVMSESFEGYNSQLNGGWGVFGTLNQANCQSSICQGKSWGTTNAGVEVDQIAAIQTGDGVQYGEAFAELDSDCNNRVGTTTTAQTNACKQSGQTTNSSINMAMTLPAGNYEVRYVYTARKNVGAYQYPNDSLICSNPADTDGLQRDADVAKNGAGVSTVSLDGQTRRIELWVEPSSSGYRSDDQSVTVGSSTANTAYVKAYMVDVCVWSRAWTERSYKFTVTRQQEYRISWRAGGLDDSFGGLIDYLRVCQDNCP